VQYNKKSIEDVQVKGKRIIARCDFNVPQDAEKNITDDKRIRESLPTIKYLADNGAKVVLCSHLGRPKGFDDKFSLAPVAKRLSELLGRTVVMANDVVGEDARAKAAALKEGDVLLLENVRFHPEEEKNNPEFAKKLADFAELYVNDAFGTAHRAHASTAGIADYLPAVCGFLIKKEIGIMGEALANPRRPFVAVLGGAKVSDKIGVINNLLDKVDALVIGGGMTYTFVKAQGGSIGKSICEEDKVGYAAEMLEKAKQKGVKLLLPVDTVAADAFSADANTQTVDSRQIPDGWLGLDIGPATIAEFTKVLSTAGTVIWNGTMGVSEMEKFAKGTVAVAKAIAESGAISIIGGGDTAAAVEQFGYASKMTHVSTGGGASLEFLEGLVLPGIACLQDK